MLSIDKIRAALQDMQISRVAEKTGLSRATITAVRDGNPCRKPTQTVLSAYIAGLSGSDRT
jgi:DNA-binding phage protein